MTQEEIIENNKLIAEFMGYKLITPNMRVSPESWSHSYWQKDYPSKQDVLCEEKYLSYHSSWKWLMPVVEKIESLDWQIEIKSNHCIINCGSTPNKFFETAKLKDTKLESTYEAIVEFIKWYNEQQKR